MIFSCENGFVERLALQAAVGAVQARASIRLRRLPAAFTNNPEALRMEQDYIAPRAADLDWADGNVFAVPAGRVTEVAGLGISAKPVMPLSRCGEASRQAGFHVLPVPQELDLSEASDCLRAGRLFAEQLRAVTGSRAAGSAS